MCVPRLLILIATACLAPAAAACTIIPAESMPPSSHLLDSSTRVYLGMVRSVQRWDEAEGLHYVVVDVRETLKGEPAAVVGAFSVRWHCRPGMCPCARLERWGDRVIVYQLRASGHASEPSPMFVTSLGNVAYIRALRAFARGLPGYKPAPREKPEWWRGAADAVPFVRD
jgi:hypothetical protein